MNYALSYFIKKFAGEYVDDIQMTTRMHDGKLEITIRSINLKPEPFRRLERELRKKGHDIFSHGVEIVYGFVETAYIRIPVRNMWSSRWEVSVHGIDIHCRCLSDMQMSEMRQRSREQAAEASYKSTRNTDNCSIRKLSSISPVGVFPPPENDGQSDESLAEKIDKYFRKNLDLTFLDIRCKLFLKEGVCIPTGAPEVEAVWNCSIKQFSVNIGASMIEWPAWAQSKVDLMPREETFPGKAETWSEDVSICIKGVEFAVFRDCFCISAADEMFSLHITKRSWDPSDRYIQCSGFQRIFVSIADNLSVQVDYDAIGLQWGVIEPLHEIFEGVACALPDFTDFFVVSPIRPQLNACVLRYLRCFREKHAALQEGRLLSEKSTRAGERELFRAVMEDMEDSSEVPKFSCMQVAEMYRWVTDHKESTKDVDFVLAPVQTLYAWYIFPFYRFEVVMWITSTIRVQVESIAITLLPELRTVMVRNDPGHWLIDTAAHNVHIRVPSSLDMNVNHATVTMEWCFQPKSSMTVVLDVQSVTQNVILSESKDPGVSGFRRRMPTHPRAKVTMLVHHARTLHDVVDDIFATKPWKWTQWSVFFGEWGTGPRPIPFDVSINVSTLTMHISHALFGEKLKLSVNAIQWKTLRNINLRALDGAFVLSLQGIEILDGSFQIASVVEVAVDVDLDNLTRLRTSCSLVNILISVVNVRVHIMPTTLKSAKILCDMAPSMPKNLENILMPDLPQEVLRVMSTLYTNNISLHLFMLNDGNHVSRRFSLDVPRVEDMDCPAGEFILFNADNSSSLRASFPMIGIYLAQSADDLGCILRKIVVDFRKIFVDINVRSVYEPMVEPLDFTMRFNVDTVNRKIELACDISEVEIILSSSYIRILHNIIQGMKTPRGFKYGPDQVHVLSLTNATTMVRTARHKSLHVENDAAIKIQRFIRGTCRNSPRMHSKAPDILVRKHESQNAMVLRSVAESISTVTLARYATMALPNGCSQWIYFNSMNLRYGSTIGQIADGIQSNIEILALQPDTVQRALREKAIKDMNRERTIFSRLSSCKCMKHKSEMVSNGKLGSLNLSYPSENHPIFAMTTRRVNRVVLGSQHGNEEIGGVLSSTDDFAAAPVAYYCQRTRNARNEELIVIRSPIVVINGTDRLIQMNIDLVQAPLRLLADCRPINLLYCGNHMPKSDALAPKGSLLPFHAGSVSTGDRTVTGHVSLCVCSEFVKCEISLVHSGTIRLSRDEVLESEVRMQDLNVGGKPRRILNIGLRAPLTFLNQAPIPLRLRYGPEDYLVLNPKYTDVIEPGGVLNLYCLLPDKFLVSVQHASAVAADTWSKYVLINRHKGDWHEVRTKVRLSSVHASTEFAFVYKKSFCTIGAPCVFQTRKMDYTLMITTSRLVPCYSVNPETYLVRSNKKYLAQVQVPKQVHTPYHRVTSFIRTGGQKLGSVLMTAGRALQRTNDSANDSDICSSGKVTKQGMVKLPDLFFSAVKKYCSITLYSSDISANGQNWKSYPLQCIAEKMPQYFGPDASISGTIIAIQPRYFIVNRTKLQMHFRLVDTQQNVKHLSTPLGPKRVKPIWLPNLEMKYPIVEISTQGGFWSNMIPFARVKTGRYSMAFGELVLTVDLLQSDDGMYLVLRSKVHFTFCFDSSAKMVQKAGLLTDSKEHRVFWAHPPEDDRPRSGEVAIGFVDPFTATQKQLNTVEIILPSLRGVFSTMEKHVSRGERTFSLNTLQSRMSEPDIDEGIYESVRFSIQIDSGSFVILIGPSTLTQHPSKVLCVMVLLMRSSTQVRLLAKSIESLGGVDAIMDHSCICTNCGGGLTFLISQCQECGMCLAWPCRLQPGDIISPPFTTETNRDTLADTFRAYKYAFTGATLSLEMSVKGVDISLFDRHESREILHIIVGPMMLSLDAPYGISGTKMCILSVDWMRSSARFSKSKRYKKEARSRYRDIIYTRDMNGNKLLTICSRILQISTTCITVDTLNVQLNQQIEVTVDDDLLGSLFTFILHSLDDVVLPRNEFDPQAHPSYWVTASKYKENHTLAMNIILKVRTVTISSVQILIWAKVNFKKVPSVPHYISNLLRIFTLWEENITLKRAVVHVESKTIENVHQPLIDFAKSMLARYSWDIGLGVLKLVGSSNLFNLFSFIYAPIYRLIDSIKSRRNPDSRRREQIYVDTSHDAQNKESVMIQSYPSIDLDLRKHQVRYLFAAETLADTRLLPRRNIPRRFLMVQKAYEDTHPLLFSGLVGFFEVDDAKATIVTATTLAISIFETAEKVVLRQSRKWAAYSGISSPCTDVIHIAHADSEESVLKVGPITHFDRPDTRITIRHIAALLLKQSQAASDKCSAP